MIPRLLVALCFVLVIALPAAVRLALAPDDGPGRASGGPAPAAGSAGTLIIVTPHVEQIRQEFAHAFDRWHLERYGQHASIDWRAPGGTSEIIKLLQAQFEAKIAAGLVFLDENGSIVCPPGTIDFDLMFGGGSFDHGRLKTAPGISLPARADGEKPVPVTLSVPPTPPFAQDQLDEWYGENSIGAGLLYDPEQYWLGTAVSSFGIVYNRRVVEELGLSEPDSFRDLTDFRYAGLLALADGRHSGSVTTTYDSILNKEGWEMGWRILRELAANARYFATSSTRPPLDVSQGEAAAGLAIDFYGRAQAQSVMAPGETPATSRVGYVDPAGEVYIDADPVSIIRGGPNPELSRRFVEFCLTEEAQALWQFRAARGKLADDGERLRSSLQALRPDLQIPPGPERYELRRMPVRRVMYEQYFPLFMDQTDPFASAADVPVRGWRSAIGPVMGAFGVEAATELRRAWAHLNAARVDPSFPPDVLAEMERLFYAMPEHTLADGTRVPLSEETYQAVRRDTNSWRDPVRGARSRMEYTAFFREAFTRVSDLYRTRRLGGDS